jgi:hypothetical protein
MPLISSEDPSFTSILEATSNLQPSSCCTRPADRSAAHRETIDMIKQYTKLPENIVDDLASIIDNPENGMILDVIMHDPFDSYKWCLLPTVRMGFHRKISDTDALERMSYTNIQCTGSVMSLRVWGISERSNSRITRKLAFSFLILRSSRSMLRLPMSHTSIL